MAENIKYLQEDQTNNVSCPHCGSNQATISGFSKYLADAGASLACSSCGGLLSGKGSQIIEEVEKSDKPFELKLLEEFDHD